MAYGLLLADAQWGSGGVIDYRAEFDQLVAGILAATIGPQSRLPLLGDWVAPDGQQYNQFTASTSDFMPGHFRAFARATGNDVWNEVVAACGAAIDRLQTIFSPDTGLLPDFLGPESRTDHAPRPASPGFLEGPYDGAYRYNAGRDPWRLGVDALLNGDHGSAERARTIGRWVAADTCGDARAVRAG